MYKVMCPSHVYSHIQEVASTELLTQLHAEFEHALLSVGGTIPSRWRLTPQCNDQATDESESRIDRQELDERIETDEPSDTSPEKPTCSTAISPVERPPLSHLTQKPKLHEDLSANIPSEASEREGKREGKEGGWGWEGEGDRGGRRRRREGEKQGVKAQGLSILCDVRTRLKFVIRYLLFAKDSTVAMERYVYMWIQSADVSS